MSNAPSLPPFQILATGRGFLNDAEIDQLIAEHAAHLKPSKIGTGRGNVEVRRSNGINVKRDVKNQWLYARIWEAANEFNRRFFCVDIQGMEDIQLARYDSSELGFYDWHPDFSEFAPHRKISLTVQLSRPEEYEGGDLEFLFSGQPFKSERAKGTFIAFPSFALHRVTPVTRGTRWSLVAWISGPRWR